ncbi:MAG: serine/threonine-protein kinase [Polyangiales bacterium]
MPGATERLRQSCERRVGSKIDGKYSLDALLGFGTTGAVYRATNTWSGREVAVKVFHYQGDRQEVALQRFVREAQASNRVRKDGRVHPNVVDSIDVGRDADASFYTVQEYLRGETLLDHLDRLPHRRMPLSDVAALLPIVDAMACAHEAGVVHRDLKPENIFLAEGPEGMIPKVLDFGIAQLADARLTSSHDLMGTPAYMAPEAFLDAREVDARADVWGLGVIFYEAISGKVPFGSEADTLIAVMREIATREPPSLQESGLMGPSTWAILRRCLERDPARRYPDARALQAALLDVFPTV